MVIIKNIVITKWGLFIFLIASITSAFGQSSYTIEDDFNPLKSKTVRPRIGGGYTVEDDLNPLDSQTISPQ